MRLRIELIKNAPRRSKWASYAGFKVLICVLVYFSCLPIIQSQQEFDLRIYGGASYYLGDLTPFSHNLSLSPGEFAFGSSIGWKFDDVFTLNLKYIKAQLSGSDREANDFSRRKRNLSFISDLDEIGLSLDIYVTTVIPKLKKFGLEIYLNTAFNIFKFNPKTEFKGELIALQPLGTEGQGVFAFGNKQKYKLIQPSFALGVGLDFKLSDNIKMGFEVVPRLTWTDYLDDVSGTYIDSDLQIQEQGLLTASLANRTGEFVFGANSNQIIPVATGTQRGDSVDNDWYLMTLTYISYRFGKTTKEEERIKRIQEIKKY